MDGKKIYILKYCDILPYIFTSEQVCEKNIIDIIEHHQVPDEGWMVGRMEGYMNGYMNGQMDGWRETVYERMDGQRDG